MVAIQANPCLPQGLAFASQLRRTATPKQPMRRSPVPKSGRRASLFAFPPLLTKPQARRRVGTALDETWRALAAATSINQLPISLTAWDRQS